MVGIFLLKYLESWWKRRNLDGRYRPVSEFSGISGEERVTQHMETFPKPTQQGEKGPPCPRCGSPTVARVSTQTSELYFGCTNFAGGCRPVCGTRRENHLGAHFPYEHFVRFEFEIFRQANRLTAIVKESLSFAFEDWHIRWYMP